MADFPTLPEFGAFAAASADLNILADAIKWAVGHPDADRPLFIGFNSNPWVLDSGDFTKIGFDSWEVDRGGMFAGGTDVVITVPGVYLAFATVEVDPAASNKDAKICRNGVNIGEPNQYGVGTPAIARLNPSGAGLCAVDDVLTLEVFHDTGTSINAVAGYRFVVMHFALA